MKVIKFIAEEVNGILNFNLKFHEDLNFIIGINGSGKTTALKLMLGLITPNIEFLNKIRFKSAVLECQSDNKEVILIIAEKKEDEYIELELKIDGVSKAKNKIPIIDERFGYSDEDENLIENRRLSNMKIIRAIQDLKTPIFLGLDRRIIQRKIFEDPRREFESRKFLAGIIQKKYYSTGDPMDTSINEIQELVNDYIREIAKKQPQITEEFKSEILNNSISYIDEGRTGGTINSINEAELKEKRESLEKAVKDLAIGNFKQRIDGFFEKFQELNKEIALVQLNFSKLNTEKDVNYFSKLLSQMMMNKWQLKRIDDIIELSKEYQNKIAELREPVIRLNTILSKFFEVNSVWS